MNLENQPFLLKHHRIRIWLKMHDSYPTFLHSIGVWQYSSSISCQFNLIILDVASGKFATYLPFLHITVSFRFCFLVANLYTVFQCRCHVPNSLTRVKNSGGCIAKVQRSSLPPSLPSMVLVMSVLILSRFSHNQGFKPCFKVGLQIRIAFEGIQLKPIMGSVE